MSNQMILHIMGGSAVTLVIIVLIYFILSKKMQGSEYRKIQKLQQGTKQKSFSTEVLFQKLYLTYIKIPFIKRYALKIRRRLEIINIDDEYNTRKGTAKILTRTLAIVVPVMILTIMISSKNFLLMFILLLFELFMIDTLVDGMVDKIDNKLLVQQIDFFAEIRHAYHEFNMVEEAIYQVAQGDSAPEMSRQAEKIYEILISNDPESELEKYYDVAPNSYLKEFAGISYLTKEFGDRTVDKTSLYLKNLNNISQEMQLEILKRDKLDYVFQSLSVISILPLLCLEPIKSWAVSEFNFTKSFYYGKNGMIVQLLLVIITFICYILTRKLKGKARITESDLKEMLREVKLALLDADVNYKIVKEFTASIQEKALGQDVLKSLTPGQQVVKIVKDELVELLGGTEANINFSSNPPTIIMLVGLQGSGKTTTAGKLANLLRKQGKKPLLVACDVYRPAAIKQLQVVGAQLNIPVFANENSKDVVHIAKQAMSVAYSKLNDVVILDTAGRLQIDEELMNELKNVKARLKNIKTRGVAAPKNQTIDDIFFERLPLYKKYADITVDTADLSPEETVSRIIFSLKN